jgi:hypothetical protein
MEVMRAKSSERVSILELKDDKAKRRVIDLSK